MAGCLVVPYRTHFNISRAYQLGLCERSPDGTSQPQGNPLLHYHLCVVLGTSDRFHAQEHRLDVLSGSAGVRCNIIVGVAGGDAVPFLQEQGLFDGFQLRDGHAAPLLGLFNRDTLTPVSGKV